MKNLPFFNYRQETPDNRLVPLNKDKIVPVQTSQQLNQIGIKSTTELYNFISANPKHIEMLGTMTGLGEDELARFRENMTQKMEDLGMIDSRCGPPADPCTVLPKHLVQKAPLKNPGPTKVLPRRNKKATLFGLPSGSC